MKSRRATVHPRKLRPHDRLALIAPAFHFDHDRFVAGRAFLETHYGVQTSASDDVLRKDLYFAGSPERRCEEILSAIADPQIAGIIGIRGGYGCAGFYQDFKRELKKMRAKPKILVGYSDLTVLLNGLYQDFGWVTFHGPMVVGRPFREPTPLESSTFKQSLFTNKKLGELTHSEMLTLNPGKARAPLVGGCLALVAASLGTSYEIDTREKILFLEDIGEAPYRVDRMLTQLKHAGSFKRVKAVVFGQMTECKPHAPAFADVDVIAAIRSALSDIDVPIVYNFPAGHGSEQITFPIGVPVEVVAQDGRAPFVRFLKAGAK